MREFKNIKLVAGLGILIAFLSFCNPCYGFVYPERVATAKGLSHYTMGYIYDLIGNTKGAVLEYEQAAQFDKSNYLVHLRLGTGYARLNMFFDAIDELNLANKYNDDDVQAHYLLAVIYSSLKKYDKAAKEYEILLTKFSEVEPKNIEIYGYLGQLYYSQRKYDKAAEQFERILSIEKDNADVMYLLGALYVEMAKKDKAIEILKRSIEINPMHDGSLNTLGYLYAENDYNIDEAIVLIKKALKIDPNNAAYLDSLGWAYFKKGMYKDALIVFKKAISILKDPVIYVHIGDVYAKINNVDEAVKNWELSLELFPEQLDIIDKINKLKNTQVSR